MATLGSAVFKQAGVPEQAGSDGLVSVVIVEEQMAIREFLKLFVNGLGGFSVVGTCGSRADAESICGQLKPHLVVLDWLEADANSNASLPVALKALSPRTHVLLFSASTEPDFVQEVVNVGVAGFVDRGSDLETLGRGLHAVAEGRQFFSSRVSGVLRELLRRRVAPKQDDLLTQREREVLREISKGRYSKEIAAMFKLSVFTIENIRRRIMRKTGLRSVAELTLHAVKLGLAPRLPPTGHRAGTSEESLISDVSKSADAAG
jgi:DNA-binding NarL/FixJ family response regulator